MYNEDIRVICCDIDGTLVKDDKSLSKENIFWIKKAVFEKNIHFTLVSGRPANGIKHFYEEIGITGPMSCFNGGTLLDENGIIVDDHRMNHKTAMILCDIMDECYCDMLIFNGMTWYLQSKDCYSYEIKKKVYKSDCKTGSFRSLLKDFDTNKCVFMSKDSSTLDKVESLIKERITLKEINYFRSEDYLEVMSSGYDKGSAILALSKHYNVPTSQIMALGDADNDIAMLKIAGCSIAMANATEKAKKAAIYLTDTNNNDGVAKAIQNFVFKENTNAAT